MLNKLKNWKKMCEVSFDYFKDIFKTKKDIMRATYQKIYDFFQINFTVKSRAQKYTFPRYMFYYHIYTNYNQFSYNDLGMFLNQDHATVLNGINAVKNCKKLQELYNEVFKDE